MPTGRLVAVATFASLVVLVVPGHPPAGLLAVNTVLVVLAGLDALAATDPDRVEIDRVLPAALTLGGDGGAVRWNVRNPTNRRLRVRGADALAPSLQPTTRRFRMLLPPRATGEATVTIRPTRRGRFTPSAVVVRVDGPLGLASRQRARSLPGTLRVLPAFPSRHDAEVRIERALTVGIRSAQGRGSGTEFDSLREYGVDDEFRHIDWAATARSSRTIVRTYRAERNQQVAVLLDTGRGMAAQIGGIPRIEHGMDAAMALSSVALRLGDRCGLLAFDSEVRALVAAGAGVGQLARIVDAIYDLEPRLVESDYRAAFTAVLSGFRRRSLLVLLTELTSEAVVDELIPALPLLLARHLVVVASVADPTVSEWAGAAPCDASAAFRSAAAAQALARRATIAARLRGVGAVVVDAPPALLAGQLADSYLGLKGAGRL